MSAIDDLATELSRLPGIGRKTALRLTYHLLRQPTDQSKRLAQALLTLGERVRPCARCFNLTEDEICSICRDPRRDPTAICVVEQASDIGAIERAGEFRGLYHVLGGRLSPLDGVGPDDLTIAALVDRVSGEAGAGTTGGGVREVILATNPSLEGDATALYVQSQLANRGVTVSRIARGLPVGGDLEYADGVTIAQAITARRVM
ncbi:MAG TPA: recombination mediator RecR [Gemmatimonadaceae bacterium]|nr:recombination mediator RecR [Gemmatimonadaceae bacterium]